MIKWINDYFRVVKIVSQEAGPVSFKYRNVLGLGYMYHPTEPTEVSVYVKNNDGSTSHYHTWLTNKEIHEKFYGMDLF